MIGVPEGLQFLLRWADTIPTGTGATATRGELVVLLAGTPIWGEQRGARMRGFVWSWVDLLEHLSRYWRQLLWEEAPPLDVHVDVPALWREAEREWTDLTEEQRERAHRALLLFERAHQLAHALSGVTAEPLWVVKEGVDVVMRSGQLALRRPSHEVFATLEALGDEISTRMSGLEDQRARAAIEQWRGRQQGTSIEQFLRITTGLTNERLDEIRGGVDPTEFFGDDAARLRVTEQVAVLRMLGPKIPNEAARSIIEWVKSLPLRASTPDLDSLSATAETVLSDLSSRKAFQQGHGLARHVRAIPGMVSGAGRVDPTAALVSFGVALVEKNLGTPEVEAVATWGARGPAVLFNTEGRFSHGAEGLRATAAHELCHLLVDRRRALPLAEVLGGRAPELVEKRANAFAAELLIPGQVAFEAVSGTADVARVVKSLRAQYGVSAEIVAWQAVRWGQGLHRQLSQAATKVLRGFVGEGNRSEFDRAVRGEAGARRRSSRPAARQRAR
ncbi:MAG: hypothetical protein A2138_00920 [Deltaproteobacteria bacterium RBG_16_71_12]|nr:MAG: hypothetical protein A2138_00920 [Deltaproteobacteria bacterium RBG_16_71_12]